MLKLHSWSKLNDLKKNTNMNTHFHTHSVSFDSKAIKIFDCIISFLFILHVLQNIILQSKLKQKIKTC